MTDKRNSMLGSAMRWRLVLFVALTAVALLVAACGGSTTGSATQNPVAPAQDPLGRERYGGSYSGGVATGDTEAGAAFAQWVLDQDPQRQYITDAVVRNEQTLGVKVNPSVTKADVQRLLEALVQGMAKTFPNKPLTVNAFYQSGDKLAEATYDPRSNQVAVRFTR